MLQQDYPFRVYIHDTDCYGVMWHGSYLKYMEQARDEYMRSVGLPLQMPGKGWVYPVVEQHTRFRKPVRLHDAVVIRSTAQVQGPRVIFTQQLFRENTLCYELTTTCAVCDKQFKPLRRVPEDIQQAFAPGHY
jgi:acyl-CoA thioester hydrolase